MIQLWEVVLCSHSFFFFYVGQMVILSPSPPSRIKESYFVLE